MELLFYLFLSYKNISFNSYSDNSKHILKLVLFFLNEENNL